MMTHAGYRPLQESSLSFDQEWEKAAALAVYVGQMQKLTENMQAIGFEWSLADVLVDAERMFMNRTGA